MSKPFSELGLPEPIIEKLAAIGYTEAFPVQQSAIPPALDGRDVQGSAPTGSGKTLAFGLPMITRVDSGRRNRPAGLVLVPTRELAVQIEKDLSGLATTMGRQIASVYGGVGYGPQIRALRGGVSILVATPGRLLDLIQRGDVELTDVSQVVVDEADRMADMGFLPDVRRILDLTSPRRQTLLFSATLDGEVGALGRAYQKDPVRIDAGGRDEKKVDLEHRFWRVERSERVAHTARLIEDSGRTIVFTRTRHGADRLVKQLGRSGVEAVAMHGGRSQSQRTRALSAFASGKALALVATDVAARGIHVEDVATVVHYDMAGDHKDYVHRSGRTARAGAAGVVVTMVIDGQDRDARKLLHSLKLDAVIEAPRFDAVRPSGRTGEEARHHERRRRPSSHDASKDESRSLFVGNLPWRITSRELEDLFSAHGKVERAEISTRGRNGRSKGFGFVDIVEKQPGGATDALHGSTVGGRAIVVRPAR